MLPSQGWWKRCPNVCGWHLINITVTVVKKDYLPTFSTCWTTQFLLNREVIIFHPSKAITLTDLQSSSVADPYASLITNLIHNRMVFWDIRFFLLVVETNRLILSGPAQVPSYHSDRALQHLISITIHKVCQRGDCELKSRIKYLRVLDLSHKVKNKTEGTRPLALWVYDLIQEVMQLTNFFGQSKS